MSIPLIRNIQLNDIANGDQIDPLKLMYLLNTVLQNQHDMLNSGLNIDDNFQGSIKEVTFTTLDTYLHGDFTNIPLAMDKTFTAKGVIILQVIDTTNINTIFKDPVQITWYQSKNYINIGYVSGLENSTSYKVRICLL